MIPEANANSIWEFWSLKITTHRHSVVWHHRFYTSPRVSLVALVAMYGRTHDGALVFVPMDGRPHITNGALPPAYRMTAQPVHAQGITFVNAAARSPSPSFRPRPASPIRAIPVSLSFSEPPRARQEGPPTYGHGRTAVDPVGSARAKRPVACAAWAHNHPIQNGARPLHKMDSVAESWAKLWK